MFSIFSFLVNFPKHFTALIIKIYQKTISLDHGIMSFLYPNGYCRFHPTCSEYARQAILRFGIFKGGFLATHRLLRCHPWSDGGIDEVPGTKKVKIGFPEEESKEGADLSDQDFVKIIDLCRKQIVLPAKKAAKPFILCPVGLVGSGKTTVIKQLAEHFDLVRISNDENRKILQDEGFNLTRTAELGFGLAKELVEKGFGLAIDADCAGPKVIETIKDLAAKNGIKVFLIHINTLEDFILENLKKFRTDAGNSINSYHRRKHLHQNLDFSFEYVFDLSKGDLSRQIEECERIIEGKI